MKAGTTGILAAMLLASCNTSKNTLPLSYFEGEWNITEVNGTKPSTDNNGKKPFLGFDTAARRIYGCSGCNRIMSSFTLNNKPGTIELGQPASTMMACPDMDTEQKVLRALAEVKRYKKNGENGITLCDDSKKPVIILQKRFFPMPFAELDGTWNVVSIFGSAIPADMENQPYMIFDTENNKISGNAGCNRMFGNITVEDGKAGSLSFASVGTTRMACPNIETEQNMLAAINEVRTFGKLVDGKVALYTADGTEAIVLQKK